MSPLDSLRALNGHPLGEAELKGSIESSATRGVTRFFESGEEPASTDRLASLLKKRNHELSRAQRNVGMSDCSTIHHRRGGRKLRYKNLLPPLPKRDLADGSKSGIAGQSDLSLRREVRALLRALSVGATSRFDSPQLYLLRKSA